MRNKNGFTLVEVIIVVVVIAILLTIATFGAIRFQQDTRDTHRASDVTIIAEALEKYYDKNGQYPSCDAITQSIDTVISKTLQGIDRAVLIAPDSMGEINSIRCSSESSQASAVTYGYETPDCEYSQPCSTFILHYWSEVDNGGKEIRSRRLPTATTVTLPAPNLNGTAQFYATLLNWTLIAPAQGYTLQRSTIPSFGSTTTQNVTDTSVAETGLTGPTNYYYRVRATAGSAISPWSNTVTLRTLAIGAPTLTSSTAGYTQINSSWTTVTGATKYRVQRSTNSAFTTNLTSTDVTTLNSNAVFNQGSRYFVRVAAMYNSTLGPWSNVTNNTLGIATPATPTVKIAISGENGTWTYGVSCPTGTTASYRYNSIRDDYNNGPYTSSASSATQDVRYQGYIYTRKVQAQCTSPNAQSAWSGLGTASYERPIATPGAPTNYIPSFSSDRLFVNTRFTLPTCGPGTTNEWQYRANWNGSTVFPDVWAATGLLGFAPLIPQGLEGPNNTYVPYPKGMKTRVEARSRCVNTVTNKMSAWGPTSMSGIYTTP